VRKICVVVASRANYGRVKYLMKAVQQRRDLELQLIVSASTLLYRFGRAVDVIKADGFKPNRSLFYILEGENLVTQAKSTGAGISELATAFDDLQPDIVVSVADRFETMATAIAATYMNVPLAHIQGGEISGNIDDRVRHAITKLADLHFPSSEQSRERVIRMGEDPAYVFNVGCPSVDVLVNQDLRIDNDIMASYGGTGAGIDWTKPYVLLVQHPVTTSYGQGFAQINESLAAAVEIGLPTVVLWPNIDAGTDDVAKGIRVFRERNPSLPFHFFRNFSPEDYGRVLANAACLIGNSSSFIREGAYLGVPAVIVGDRQLGREHGRNVTFAPYRQAAIAEAGRRQIAAKRFDSDPIFGSGDAGPRMAEILASIELPAIKRMTY
jgi:GDP/UDP-N,N'-diacetylbacillosamine 2-epimerase (hydrolysing)